MIHISHEHIPTQTYQELRILSGLSPKSDRAAETGLKHSLHSVLLKDDHNRPVGMGRLIGDGGCFCQVVDICVLPEWQGKGLGKKIMQDILDFIESELPESCYISLIADGKASELYEQFGFKDTLPASKGMYLKK